MVLPEGTVPTWPFTLHNLYKWAFESEKARTTVSRVTQHFYNKLIIFFYFYFLFQRYNVRVVNIDIVSRGYHLKNNIM